MRNTVKTALIVVAATLVMGGGISVITLFPNGQPVGNSAASSILPSVPSPITQSSIAESSSAASSKESSVESSKESSVASSKESSAASSKESSVASSKESSVASSKESSVESSKESSVASSKESSAASSKESSVSSSKESSAESSKTSSAASSTAATPSSPSSSESSQPPTSHEATSAPESSAASSEMTKKDRWQSKIAILNDPSTLSEMLQDPLNEFWSDEEFWNADLDEVDFSDWNDDGPIHVSSNVVYTDGYETGENRLNYMKTHYVSTRYNGVVTNDTYYNTVVRIVANELSPSYTDTGLKCQIVAAYTFLRYHAGCTKTPPTAQLASQTVMDNRWGTAGMARLRALVAEVGGFMLFIDNHPILTTYGSINNGVTNYIGDVWETTGYDGYGTPYTYLAGGIDSHWDKKVKGYSRVVEITKAEMENALEAYLKIQLGDDPTTWLQILSRNKWGYVMNISVDDQKLITGRDLRHQVLNNENFGLSRRLRSTSFTFVYEADIECFTFSMTGYGHGVGMSQEGAEQMGKEGYTWDQILLHYFPGAVIVG